MPHVSAVVSPVKLPVWLAGIPQDGSAAEVYFPAFAVAACIILFGFILIYILRMGSAARVSRHTSSSATFSQFFNQAEVGIGVIDAEGFFVLSNQSLQDLTGYTATQLTTISFRSLFADRDDYVEPSKVAGMIDRFGESHQVFLRQRSGHLLRVRFLVLPAPETVHEDAEVLLIEAAASEGGGGEEIPEGRDSLQEAKDSFLASLHHDLKTPLTVILGSASMLHSEKKYSPELVHAILESGQRLLNDLDCLLLLAAKDQTDQGARMPANIRELVLDATSDYKRRATEKAIRIDVSGLTDVVASVDGITLFRTISVLLESLIDSGIPGCINLILEDKSDIISLTAAFNSRAIAMTSQLERREDQAGKLSSLMGASLDRLVVDNQVRGFVLSLPKRAAEDRNHVIGRAA